MAKEVSLQTALEGTTVQVGRRTPQWLHAQRGITARMGQLQRLHAHVDGIVLMMDYPHRRINAHLVITVRWIRALPHQGME